MNSHTLIIETDYGETRCHFQEDCTLAELRGILKCCGYDAFAISTSKGVARTWQDGCFQEVYDLEANIRSLELLQHIETTLEDKPPMLCPYMASLVKMMKEQMWGEKPCQPNT